MSAVRLVQLVSRLGAIAPVCPSLFPPCARARARPVCGAASLACFPLFPFAQRARSCAHTPVVALFSPSLLDVHDTLADWTEETPDIIIIGTLYLSCSYDTKVARYKRKKMCEVTNVLKIYTTHFIYC